MVGAIALAFGAHCLDTVFLARSEYHLGQFGFIACRFSMWGNKNIEIRPSAITGRPALLSPRRIQSDRLPGAWTTFLVYRKQSGHGLDEFALDSQGSIEEARWLGPQLAQSAGVEPWSRMYMQLLSAFTMNKQAFLLPILLFLWTCTLQDTEYTPREGDFVFQSVPTSDLTEAIEGATASPYSHVGLVIEKSGGWYVREAIGPVMDTPFAEWAGRGRYGQAFAAYRLREEYRNFIPALVKASEAFLGRPYDVRYRLDDENIYCSELLYKAMLQASGKRLGKLQRLGELNWRPYRATIEKYEGGEPPLERLMITPRALAEAEELEKIYSGYP